MITCGLLTNHRHGNHVLMYEQCLHDDDNDNDNDDDDDDSSN